MKLILGAMDANAQDEQNPIRHSQSSGYSFLMPQQAIPVSAGFHDNNFGRGQIGQGMSRGRFEMPESIRRELEKQRIREEIIAEEMARRRVLEAEVRNELMMERGIAMRRAACMPLSRPVNNNLSTPKILNQKPIGLEEKLVMLIDEKYGRGGRVGEVRGFSVSPLQVLGDSPKITAIPMPALEENRKEVIVYGKPDCEILSGTKRKSTPPVSERKPDGETLSGTKRKSIPPVSEGSIQSGSDRSNKRVKEEWTCAVCQISTTSEQGLTQHLQGKKHQTKEAALVAQRTGANFGLGVSPKNPIIKPPQLALKTVTVSSNETNKPSNSSDPNDVNKKDMHLALTVFKPSSFETDKLLSSSGPNDIKSGKNKKDKFKFWCEMCQVGAFSEAVMNDHKEGKKHSARLIKFYRRGKVDLEASATTNTCDGKDKTETKSNQAVEYVAEENNETN